MSSKSSPVCLAPSPPAALGEVAQAEKTIKSWQILSIFECFAISPLLLYTDELILEKELSPPSHCSVGRQETGPGFISPDSFGTRRGTWGGWICEGNEEEWGLGYVPEQLGSASCSPVVTENIHGLSRAPGNMESSWNPPGALIQSWNSSQSIPCASTWLLGGNRAAPSAGESRWDP